MYARRIDEKPMKKIHPCPRIQTLIPHRPPMLLIHEIVALSESHSSAKVLIEPSVPFFNSATRGVPTWIGLEYMGQTAALIGGFQAEHSKSPTKLGFLIGTRQLSLHSAQFDQGMTLIVTCEEKATVGDDLATFQCQIVADTSEFLLAEADLTVLRRSHAGQ